MALVNVSGSSSQITSSSNEQVINTNSVETTDIRNKQYVLDTLKTKTALSSTRQSDTLKCLAGYTAGTPVTVLYYNNNKLADKQQGVAIDFDLSVDSVHCSYTQIENFELRLTSEFDYSFNEAEDYSTVTGEAVTYPNFNPIKGDIFLYETLDGHVGLFKVTSVERLAYHNRSFHRITYQLVYLLTDEIAEKIAECVKYTVVFEKIHYLETDGGFFTNEDYNTREALRELQVYLSKSFKGKYLDRAGNTFYHPTEGYYDPYVVDVFNRNTLVQVTGGRAHQMCLLDRYSRYDILSMLDPFTMQHVNELYPFFVLNNDRPSYRKTTLNHGVNKDMLSVEDIVAVDIDEEAPYYIFSEDFYTLDTIETETEHDLDAFDLFIFNYLKNKTYDNDELIAFAKNVYIDNTPEKAFYRVPILLTMINYSLHSFE